jgi:predicted site-specific integrase-resolvase
MKYKISRYAALHGVTYRTVWNWIGQGRLKTEKDDTGHTWIIDDAGVERTKTYAVYARVSSSGDKKNLDTQAERLISFCNARGYKVKKVVKEIGSGLNDQRPKLEKLLLDKEIDVIVVEHKDRLARFGLNYIQKLLSLQGREIEIVNEVDGEKEDLMQDFVSIISTFCARLYGKKRTKRMTEKLVKKLEEDKDATSGETHSEGE